MDASKPIDEALTLATFRKAVKNLTDARTEFEKGGRADLVAANFGSGSVNVLLGRGDGTFAAPQDFEVGSSPTSVAVADVKTDPRVLCDHKLEASPESALFPFPPSVTVMDSLGARAGVGATSLHSPAM